MPLLARPDLRRGIVVALSLATLAGGLRVWLNASRSDALRSYVRGLVVAQDPLRKHLDPGRQNAVNETVRKFVKGEVAVAEFRKLAEAWEADFRAARRRVEALRPPLELASAERALIEGIDLYVGVARMYNLAGQQRAVADRQPAAVQSQFENMVQVTLQQAQEWQGRAENVFAIGSRRIDSLRREWLGEEPWPEIPGVPHGLLTATPTAAPPQQ